MAKFVLKNAFLEVDGKALSDRVRHIEVTMNADDIESSTMGEGVHQHLAGLRADNFVVTFASDFDAGKVDDVLYPLLATADVQPEFTVKCSPFGPTASATNPVYTTGKAILLNYSPIAGDIGALSEVQVTIPSNEAIVRSYT